MKTFQFHATYHKILRKSFVTEVFANTREEAEEIGRHFMEKEIGQADMPNIRVDTVQTTWVEDWDGR